MTQLTSKKHAAGAIFDRLIEQNRTRKEIIHAMVEGAKLTVNGAATYYANFKSGHWTTTPSAPTATAPAPVTSDFVLFTESGSTINVTRELHGEPEPEPEPTPVVEGRRPDSALDKPFALQSVWG